MSSQFALCVVVGVGLLGAAELGPELASLVDAERQFARACAASGIRSGFLEYLAQDSIVFRPAPVDARGWYSDQPAPSGLLSWEPRFAEISRSREFGYTTGPWEFRRDPGATDADAEGDYVSVWRRIPGGRWRVLIDVGTTDAPGRPAPSPLSFREPARSDADASSSVDVSAAESSLLDAEHRFSELALRQGERSAYADCVTDDVRFYRRGARPLIGRLSIDAILEESTATWVARPLAAEVATSGDLGVTYGRVESRSAAGETGATVTGYYLRIWRRAAAGDWRLALDLVLDIAPSATRS